MRLAGPTVDHAEIRAWAEIHNLVPVEILPPYLTHGSMFLCVMLPEAIADRTDIRFIAWEEFFAEFDLMGLTFVYDDDSGGYSELLMAGSEGPYRDKLPEPID